MLSHVVTARHSSWVLLRRLASRFSNVDLGLTNHIVTSLSHYQINNNLTKMNVQRDQASLPYEHISTSSVSDLRIDEKDSSDTYSATYVETRLAEGGARVDVIVSTSRV